MNKVQAEKLLEYIDQRIADLIEESKPAPLRPAGWYPINKRLLSDELRYPLLDILSEEK
jgi:hypothetical protein